MFEKFLAGKKNSNMIDHINLWISIKKFTTLYDEKKAENHIQTSNCLKELQDAIKSIQTTTWTLQQNGSVRLPKGLENGVSNQFSAAPDENTILLCNKLMNFLADVLHTNVQKAFLKSSLFEEFQRHAPEDFVLDTGKSNLVDFTDMRLVSILANLSPIVPHNNFLLLSPLQLSCTSALSRTTGS